MKIAFTICSNNYLSRAKTLCDSITKFAYDHHTIIVLCDEYSSAIDYSFFNGHRLIPVTELGIKNFDSMRLKYKIVEFNTAIKPFVFDYIYHNLHAEIVTYIDPDICLFAPLDAVENEHKDCSMLLTPHILTPLDFDGLTPTENTFTQYGIFNLGFLATKRDKNTFNMLEWWKSRLEVNCFKNPQEGIFVDQLPMNFAPIFFEGVKFSKNPGLNMAPWNLHERTLSLRDGTFFVNSDTPLIFYHFSKFQPGIKTFAQPYSREPQGNSDALAKLHDIYESKLVENRFHDFADIKYAYTLDPTPPFTPPPPTLIQRVLRRLKGCIRYQS